jgi:hypothetical protein
MAPEAPDRAGFVLAFDASYLRMATALVHALHHFHPGAPIRVYTLPDDLAALSPWARRLGGGVEVIAYRPPAALSSGEWHPLIWAKLEAFAAEDAGPQVVLDVDQILYRPVSGHVARALASGRWISASPDITDLRGHVQPWFTGEPLDALAGVPCFNAGAMIVRPSRPVYQELVALARRHHAEVRLPEQAILNLWALRHDGHHDLGDAFMLAPWSPRVLEPAPACLIHFWTPRPAFFGPSPARSLEPSLEDCLTRFEHQTGQRYPLERFERDFTVRLDNALAGDAP